MITVFNTQNYAQQWFFDKAFATLKAKGKLSDQELDNNRFLSLDGYFAHMQDLILIDPSFVLIPSDEKPFEINANTRTISIPADFNKCAGVAGDDMCEIITFTVDRYFDYVDLATANICIQWSTPAGEGISHIGLKDLETISGKIRFGWPLTNELTANPGPITFAVRFFIKDEEDNFVYLLNTLSASFIIRQGLNITNPDITEKDVDSLFGQFVQNSTNPSYPQPAPVYFNDNPGINLLPQAKIDSNNQLTLNAQAVVADNGHIVYNWYFKEKATPTSDTYIYEKATEYDEQVQYYTYNVETKTYSEVQIADELEFQKGTYYTKRELVGSKIDLTDERFNISEQYVEIQTPEKRNGSEQYYIKVSEEEGPRGYQLVTSADLPKDQQLYERITSLQIVPSDRTDITGLYWVGASNYVGEDKLSVTEENYPEENRIYAINHTPEVTSARCYVPTPAEIKIINNLPKNVFLEQDKDDTSLLSTTLSIATELDGGDPSRTYSWYYSTDPTIDPTGDTKLAEVTDQVETGNSYKVKQKKAKVDAEGIEIAPKEDKRGWYYAKINSKLNRASTNIDSVVCRVLEPVKAPILTKMEYAYWSPDKTVVQQNEYFNNPNNWNPVYDSTTGTITAMDESVSTIGTILRLRITTNLDNATFGGQGLESDSLKYEWYIIEPDATSPHLLDKNYIGSNNYLLPESKYINTYDSNQIDIRCLSNLNEDRMVRVFCQVTNTLAGESAKLEEKDYKEKFQIW